MEQFEIKSKRFALSLFGALLLPIAVLSLYLLLTRWPSYQFTATSDFGALVFSVLLGATLIATLPIRPLHRAASLVVYIPLFSISLFYYTFLFIAVILNDAL